VSVLPPVRRVLLLHDYAGLRGGAEVVMQDMRAALRRRGIDARLMASTADPAGEATAADHTFQGSTGAFRALRETVNPDAVRVVREVVRRFDPQIVHLGMILTQASPAILPILKGRAVVWAPNEYRAICPSGSRFLPDHQPCSYPAGRACLRNRCFRAHGLVPRLLQLALLRHWRPIVDLVVCPSRAFADELERHGVSVDAIVPNGIRIQPLVEQPASVPAFLGFAGRLVPEKGTHILIEALSLLPRSLAHVRLRIAGDGPERASLEGLARKLGLGDRVEFLGHLTREDVERWLATATVHVVPSLWAEPFGLVAIEAMARGTPVMVSAAGALPELVEEGRTGYVVAPGDAGALARRLAEVMADPASLASVRREARRVACETFSIERTVDRFLALYAGLVNPAVATR
jgi:glycosyltransferase involved in cell wall biosynthesis